MCQESEDFEEPADCVRMFRVDEGSEEFSRVFEKVSPLGVIECLVHIAMQDCEDKLAHQRLESAFLFVGFGQSVRLLGVRSH